MEQKPSNRSHRSSRIHNVSAATNQRRPGELSSSMQRMVRSRQKNAGNTTYNAERIVDNGTFGVVYQATVAETGKLVAIKKVYQDPRYKNRELEIMKEIGEHPNVIQLLHAFYTEGDKPNELYLNVVMDFVPSTIYKVVRQYKKMRQQIPMLIVKLYAYQFMRGSAFVHAAGICHRDIKPQNYLVNPTDHVVRLCDFGSAKRLIKGEPNVSYICSRYYRAPELIFGSTDYSNSIDVWSIGCVIAELILLQPLFPGESGVDQLVEIIKILGTPTRQQIHDMNPNYTEHRFPEIKPYSWNRVFRSRAPPDALDFISQLLVYSPQLRPKPLESLLHPFFDELRDQNTRLPDGSALPNLFNWTEPEIETTPAEVLERLTPSWYIDARGQFK